MDSREIAVIVIVAIIVLSAVAWFAIRRRRTDDLRRRFGPEYERTVREHGVQRADGILLERERRVEKLSLRRLSPDEREQFISRWRAIQSQFVDDPAGAVADADQVVEQLMEARGYPLSDFEQRAADISVDHPRVVDNYRAAHQIALRHRRGQTSTEDLRNSVIYYRLLFEDLLETTIADSRTTTRKEVA